MFGFLLGAGSNAARATNKAIDVNYADRKAGRIVDGGCLGTKLKIQPYAPPERLSELCRAKSTYGRDSEVYREIKRDVYREAAENKRSQDIAQSTIKALGCGAGALISFKLGGADIDLGS